MNAVFQFEIQVSPQMVDVNRHVNNVAYVQWMQDAAVRHSAAAGCSQMTAAMEATWVARTHHIEYLAPAFSGQTITAFTWVSNFRKVRSLRKYKFVRFEDNVVVAEGETDWVFVERATGRPRAIPVEIQALFVLVGPENEPDFRRKISGL